MLDSPDNFKSAVNRNAFPYMVDLLWLINPNMK